VAINDLLSVDKHLCVYGSLFFCTQIPSGKKLRIRQTSSGNPNNQCNSRFHLSAANLALLTLPMRIAAQNGQKKFAAYSTANTPLQAENFAACREKLNGSSSSKS
jgi:hypothetical protein